MKERHGTRTRRRLLAALVAALVALAAALALPGAALAEDAAARSGSQVTVWRLYNRWSGEHLFTTDREEYDGLVAVGWSGEGEAWRSPAESDNEVWRLARGERQRGLAPLQPLQRGPPLHRRRDGVRAPGGHRLEQGGPRVLLRRREGREAHLPPLQQVAHPGHAPLHDGRRRVRAPGRHRLEPRGRRVLRPGRRRR